jgi:adenine phosphoribosyltransferase
MDLSAAVRTIPDYPKPGILFRDITTLLGDAEALRQTVEQLSEPFKDLGVTKVAGLEARGFILGGAVACQLGAGFIPLRKRGKLPHHTYAVEYALEYGMDALEMHKDACEAGERIMLIDDLIATGGTAVAGVELLRRGGAQVVAAGFVIDLPDLGGAARLQALDVPVRSLIAFPGH